MPHVVVDISGHGLGHAGQVLPVVQDLLAMLPEVQVTLRTAVPPAVLVQHVGRALPVLPPPADVGMVMTGPMDVDVAASAAAYVALHDDFSGVLAREAERLTALEADLLLADVPYTSIAAAARVALPAVALCSLNWLDTYRAYCAEQRAADWILRQIREAYAAADLFLQPRPHTPMSELSNTRSIPPVCRTGTNRRTELRRQLGVPEGTALVAAGFGGLPGVALADLPRLDGVCWVQADAPADRDDVFALAATEMDFADLAASVDLVVTKSGYGTLCETLAAGTRLLLVSRPGWPENPAMQDWLAQYNHAGVISRAAATPAGLARAVRDLLDQPQGKPVPPTGRSVAVQTLRSYLGM